MAPPSASSCHVPLPGMLGSTRAAGLFGAGSAKPRRTAATITAAVVALQILTIGCAAYRVGNGTLYAPDVSTVYVPIIQSNSFRRELGEMLTEAVIKEIELKTPFKVVGTPDADSALVARVLSDFKDVTIENPNDDPRAVNLGLVVEVTWQNRRRQPIAPPTVIPLPPELFIPMTGTAPQIPEAGQSVAAQQMVAIERLAQQIVATMEEPW